MGMHGEQDGAHDGAEQAWSGFRARLADRLAVFEDDEMLEVEVQVGVSRADLHGASPYLQFCGWGEEMIRAEAVSNHYLDERFALDADAEEQMLAWWRDPDEDELNFHLDVERRDADRLAVTAVRTLREVYGVLHPAFLDAAGLEVDPRTAGPEVAAGVVDTVFDLDATTLPRTSEELQELLDATLAEVLVTVEHDEDGDVPCRAGRSMVFVRVLPDRPAVEFFAELVLDAAHPERMPVELDLLNRGHAFARFSAQGTTVRMSHVLHAWPFVPRQVHQVLRQFLDDVDPAAEALAARIGGRRFLDEPEPERSPQVPEHPGLVGLLELLHLGPVSSPAVGGLYEHDREAIIAHLVAIRSGFVDCGGHEETRVLTALRRGLRYVVDREIPERRARRLPPRPRTEQPSLLSDDDAGEDTLDIGYSA